MSLSRQVPLGYGGATYTHLPNSTRNNIPLRQVVVNPDIRNITNIYEGLNAYQAGSLDAAIEIGASRSANKVGSLEHINKVKEALDDMITSPTNAYYRDSLIEVKKRIDDILQTKADKILRPYNAYENFVNSISDKMQYIYPYIGGYYMQNRQPL
ncbi:MAG: iron-containing alcohol dehydrogenase [Alphaproteobacteria bacterium]|nr:iron-containing alcohol dehydrogenase [Alphaproteobacteria bacterium]